MRREIDRRFRWLPMHVVQAVAGLIEMLLFEEGDERRIDGSNELGKANSKRAIKALSNCVAISGRLQAFVVEIESDTPCSFVCSS